jgi:imidazoleglycerol phosphate dehydratase HisB
MRETRETSIELEVCLDGRGEHAVSTGLGFLDHMLASLAVHGCLDLRLECRGDLDVDDHHTVEDCAIALGVALDKAIGEREGITRFATAFAPLDESLARAVIDISSRPFAHVDLGLRRDSIGAVATENITHFFSSLATAARVTLHLDVISGANDHHRAEAAFKALALALREAVAIDPRRRGVPSTKGAL